MFSINKFNTPILVLCIVILLYIYKITSNKEFFQQNEKEDISESFQEYLPYSCAGRCGKPTSLLDDDCHCTPNCSHWQNCCTDYEEVCLQTKTTEAPIEAPTEAPTKAPTPSPTKSTIINNIDFQTKLVDYNIIYYSTANKDGSIRLPSKGWGTGIQGPSSLKNIDNIVSSSSFRFFSIGKKDGWEAEHFPEPRAIFNDIGLLKDKLKTFTSEKDLEQYIIQTTRSVRTDPESYKDYIKGKVKNIPITEPPTTTQLPTEPPTTTQLPTEPPTPLSIFQNKLIDYNIIYYSTPNIDGSMAMPQEGFGSGFHGPISLRRFQKKPSTSKHFYSIGKKDGNSKEHFPEPSALFHNIGLLEDKLKTFTSEEDLEKYIEENTGSSQTDPESYKKHIKETVRWGSPVLMPTTTVSGPPIMNEKVIYYNYTKDDTGLYFGPISYNEVLIKNKEKEISIYKIYPLDPINLQQLNTIVNKYNDIDEVIDAWKNDKLLLDVPITTTTTQLPTEAPTTTQLPTEAPTTTQLPTEAPIMLFENIPSIIYDDNTDIPKNAVPFSFIRKNKAMFDVIDSYWIQGYDSSKEEIIYKKYSQSELKDIVNKYDVGGGGYTQWLDENNFVLIPEDQKEKHFEPVVILPTTTQPPTQPPITQPPIIQPPTVVEEPVLNSVSQTTMSPSVLNSNNQINKNTLQEVINNSVTLNNNSENKAKKFLESLDQEKLVSLLTSMLNTPSVDKQAILNKINMVKDAILKSPQNNINDEDRLLEILKMSIKNQNFSKLTSEEKYILMKSDKDKIWETIFEISESHMKNKKYSSAYAPGWSYLPPYKWDTHRRRVPPCINNSKTVEAPAFVFGSGVPANALELTDDDFIGSPGAGGVGSMMPKFSYREDPESQWFTNGVPDNSFLSLDELEDKEIGNNSQYSGSRIDYSMYKKNNSSVPKLDKILS